MVTKDYVVGTCRRTRELLEWGWAMHGLWTPTYTVAAATPGAVKRVCAMPGYAFVPASAWGLCLGMAPPFFNLRALANPSENWAPYTVTMDELRVLQKQVQDEVAKQLVDALPVPVKPGDRVRLTCPPFVDLVGTVEKVRGSTVRVLVGLRFVTVDRLFLQLDTKEDL